MDCAFLQCASIATTSDSASCGSSNAGPWLEWLKQLVVRPLAGNDPVHEVVENLAVAVRGALTRRRGRTAGCDRLVQEDWTIVVNLFRLRGHFRSPIIADVLFGSRSATRDRKEGEMRKSIRNCVAMHVLVCTTGLLAAAPANAVDLEAIKADIARYQAIPEFSAPGEPFDARACMQGKKILTVPFASQIPFVSTVVTAMVGLGEEIGFAYDEYRNTGQRSQWIQGISHGINQGYNLIDLFAPDLLALVPQAREAADAGIPVVASHDGGYEQIRPEPFLWVPADYRTAGQLLAKWAIMRTEGKANVMVLTALDSYSSESIIAGVKEGFVGCEECQVEYVNIAVGDWATRIQPTVQAALIGNPDLNFILPTYDPMTQFIVPAIELTQTGDRVKVASFNGTPFALDFVREGKLDMIIAENLDWVAHGIVDAEMRIVCGLEQVTDPKLPLRIFDASNVEEAGVPAQPSTGFGDAYKEGYRKLWGLM